MLGRKRSGECPVLRLDHLRLAQPPRSQARVARFPDTGHAERLALQLDREAIERSDARLRHASSVKGPPTLFQRPIASARIDAPQNLTQADEEARQGELPILDD